MSAELPGRDGRAGGRPPALAAALRYVERGWPVLPLFSVDERGCECRRRGCDKEGKHPRLGKGGAHRATLDADQVREWWRMWPTSNVGIGCGRGLIVYDIDPPHGGESTFENAIGGRPFPRVPTVCTGGGGLHFYFAGDGPAHDFGALGDGVDVKGLGGLVVAPPSLHVSGNRYGWLVYDAEPVPAPDYFPRARAKPEHVTDRAPVRARSSYVRAAFRSELRAVRAAPEGSRNETLNTSVLKIARFVGPGQLDEDAVRRAFLEAALASGLTRPEIDATIRSALTAGGVLA